MTDTLRKLAEAATPGPWAMVPAGNKPEVMCGARSGWGSTTICRVESLNFVEDARFIAAANPTAVIALLDEIDALRAKVKVLVEALSDAQNHLEYCGWGDKWERECAIEGKLPNKIASALLTAQEAGND